ncbi:MAG: hypothetical protein A2Y89_06965 [Chloroflexi bacterium RBG_13_51_18]|nr:MAG: hypothetical protein A2Y89_06965 [Chloroflexi bacterium RBG_13_51_18]
MAEELGKIDKPPAENFKKGRKLIFVPVVYQGEGLPEDYTQKYTRFWKQVEEHIAELSSKLGEVNVIYHELIALSGEEGATTLKDLNSQGYKIVKTCIEKKARLEGLEDADLLTEFMDWSRCLMIGLQNPKVITKIYDSYVETGKKRNESIAEKINKTLKEDEIGIILMRENHQVQFPSDIQIFYVSPPALDDIKRWLRDYDQKTGGETDEK